MLPTELASARPQPSSPMMHIPRARLVPPSLAAARNMSSSSSFASSSALFPPPDALPLSQPSPSSESAAFDAHVAALTQFFARPRFAGITRPYTAREVALKQGSAPVLPLPSTLAADKLFRRLQKAREEGVPVHTMGAIDPVQMSQMVQNQEAVYVSGWACSSVLTTANNEVGPDYG